MGGDAKLGRRGSNLRPGTQLAGKTLRPGAQLGAQNLCVDNRRLVSVPDMPSMRLIRLRT
jgi:hypothetical protein